MRENLANNIDNETLLNIVTEMKTFDLPASFIVSVVSHANKYEGIFDLMVLWQESIDEDKQEIIADLQELIDDCSRKGVEEGIEIRFDDLPTISKNIREFKDELRLIVEDNGGINELSKKTDIPQPSLSRFFSNNSMPRRLTLLKIQRALKLDAVHVATEWSLP